jgi:hypothetical protein
MHPALANPSQQVYKDMERCWNMFLWGVRKRKGGPRISIPTPTAKKESIRAKLKPKE